MTHTGFERTRTVRHFVVDYNKISEQSDILFYKMSKQRNSFVLEIHNKTSDCSFSLKPNGTLFISVSGPYKKKVTISV